MIARNMSAAIARMPNRENSLTAIIWVFRLRPGFAFACPLPGTRQHNRVSLSKVKLLIGSLMSARVKKELEPVGFNLPLEGFTLEPDRFATRLKGQSQDCFHPGRGREGKV